MESGGGVWDSVCIKKEPLWDGTSSCDAGMKSATHNMEQGLELAPDALPPIVWIPNRVEMESELNNGDAEINCVKKEPMGLKERDNVAGSSGVSKIVTLYKVKQEPKCDSADSSVSSEAMAPSSLPAVLKVKQQPKQGTSADTNAVAVGAQTDLKVKKEPELVTADSHVGNEALQSNLSTRSVKLEPDWDTGVGSSVVRAPASLLASEVTEFNVKLEPDCTSVDLSVVRAARTGLLGNEMIGSNVKLELEWDSSVVREPAQTGVLTSKVQEQAESRTSLLMGLKVKEELDPSRTSLLANPNTSVDSSVVRAPASLLASEVKEEWSGESAAAARARLYAGHAVRAGLALGPEGLQPPDVAFTLHNAKGAANMTTVAAEPATAPAPAPAPTALDREPRDSLLVIRNPEHDDKPHACDICNRAFKKRGKLTVHKKTHTGERPFACDKCPKKFTRRPHLKAHERLHTGEKPYACDQCEKRFTQPNHLKTHRVTHAAVKPHSCDVCPMQFTHPAHLASHKRLHTGEKPYSCATCGREFAKLSYLKEHSRVHAGAKAYSCDSCHKEFTRLGQLRRHRRIHTREKPYSCALCSKAFTQRSHLTRHQLVHSGATPYSCGVCGRGFGQKVALVKHTRLHSRERLEPGAGAGADAADPSSSR